MKKNLVKQLANVLFIILGAFTLGALLVISNYFIRGMICIFTCLLTWILVRKNPYGRLFSLGSGSVYSSISYKTMAIISTVDMIIYWIVVLIMLLK